MKKLNQKGFTLVEGLLIVIAIGIVIGVGYYIYNANRDTNKQVVVTAAKKTVEQTSPEDFLVIKELGIQFEKSTLPTTYYKIGDAKTGYPNVPELSWINLHETGYDETKNSKGHKCSDASLGTEIITVQVMKKTDRDAKYANYKNATIGPNDDVPTVVSDRYNRESDGYLYDYFKSQGVQAMLNCVADADTNNGDYEAEAAKNKNVVDKFESDYTKLQQVIKTLQKN